MVVIPHAGTSTLLRLRLWDRSTQTLPSRMPAILRHLIRTIRRRSLTIPCHRSRRTRPRTLTRPRIHTRRTLTRRRIHTRPRTLTLLRQTHTLLRPTRTLPRRIRTPHPQTLIRLLWTPTLRPRIPTTRHRQTHTRRLQTPTRRLQTLTRPHRALLTRRHPIHHPAIPHLATRPDAIRPPTPLAMALHLTLTPASAAMEVTMVATMVATTAAAMAVATITIPWRNRASPP